MNNVHNQVKQHYFERIFILVFLKAFQGLMPTCKICQCSSTNLTCMDLRKVDFHFVISLFLVRILFSRNKMMMLMLWFHRIVVLENGLKSKHDNELLNK